MKELRQVFRFQIEDNVIFETFRSEKSARNWIVSSAREFWNLGSKTKSWNFEEVR